MADLIKRGEPLNPCSEIACGQQQVDALRQLYVLFLVFTNIILHRMEGAWSVAAIV